MVSEARILTSQGGVTQAPSATAGPPGQLTAPGDDGARTVGIFPRTQRSTLPMVGIAPGSRARTPHAVRLTVGRVARGRSDGRHVPGASIARPVDVRAT